MSLFSHTYRIVLSDEPLTTRRSLYCRQAMPRLWPFRVRTNSQVLVLHTCRRGNTESFVKQQPVFIQMSNSNRTLTLHWKCEGPYNSQLWSAIKIFQDCSGSTREERCTVMCMSQVQTITFVSKYFKLHWLIIIANWVKHIFVSLFRHWWWYDMRFGSFWAC